MAKLSAKHLSGNGVASAMQTETRYYSQPAWETQ